MQMSRPLRPASISCRKFNVFVTLPCHVTDDQHERNQRDGPGSHDSWNERARANGAPPPEVRSTTKLHRLPHKWSQPAFFLAIILFSKT